MSDDWYRNETWDDASEQAFRAKLRRARDKPQYVRIQASILAKAFPRVALRLLEEYFELGDRTFDAQAHVDRATAYVALGDHARALAAYDSALLQEERFPNVGTRAHIEMPLLVARLGLADRYDRALQVLANAFSQLGFPIDCFQWHAAMALISSAMGKIDDAQAHARSALEFAAVEHSGLRHHGRLGLVGDSDDELRKALVLLVAPN